MTRIALLLAGVWVLTTVGCCQHRPRHATFAPPPGTAPVAWVQPYAAPVRPHMMSASVVDPQVQLHEHYHSVDSRLHSVTVR